MTEPVDTAAEGTPVEQTPEREYSPVEVKAIEQGWIPKEEFDGDEQEFIDAPEFVRRGDLFRKIETQSKEIRAVRQALEALKVHNSKIQENEYARALKTLQAARKQAFVEGEHDRAFALEEKIDEIKAEKEQLKLDPAPVVEETYTPEFQNWVSRNDWYETNKVMRKTADALGIELAQEGYPSSKVLELVEAEIRKEFAHKFSSPAAKRAMAVEAPTRNGGSKSTKFEMDSTETAIMRKIVASGVMTEKEYIQQLKATREV